MANRNGDTSASLDIINAEYDEQDEQIPRRPALTVLGQTTRRMITGALLTGVIAILGCGANMMHTSIQYGRDQQKLRSDIDHNAEGVDTNAQQFADLVDSHQLAHKELSKQVHNIDTGQKVNTAILEEIREDIRRMMR